MNELILNDNTFDVFQVSFQQGKVEVAGYPEIYTKLTELSDYLKHITITKDNIKENKKLVAKVSKATKEMNDARIMYKKKYLEPFNVYEEQVKTLTQLVKEAEETVRQQIRELDEIEREEKEQELHKLFDKRKRPYKLYGQFLKFEDFLKPQHLNKSVSISKVEQEMTEWLERTNNDLELLANLSKRDELNFYDAVPKYLELFNITDTINFFIDKKKQEEEMRETIIEQKMEPPRGVQQQKKTLVIFKTDREGFHKDVAPLLNFCPVEYEIVE